MISLHSAAVTPIVSLRNAAVIHWKDLEKKMKFWFELFLVNLSLQTLGFNC